jgi:dipeptidyl aminopeptidase/acylaminoacyl peptidase
MKARLLAVTIAIHWSVCAAEKPPLTLDEFFDSVDLADVKISPDGRAVVIESRRADWGQNRFRNDLWLYRDEGKGSLLQLTQSGHDRGPEWSPDGRWIAFLSDRKPQFEGKKSFANRSTGRSRQSDDNDSADSEAKLVDQVYLIAADGGEAFPLTAGGEEVHAFAWAADSKGIFYATREHWGKEQEEDYKKEWKDVIQYRESERSDAIWVVDIQAVIEHGPADQQKIGREPQPAIGSVAKVPERVKQLAVSPDGKLLAYLTESRSQRQESMEDYSIFVTPARANGETAAFRAEHAPAVFEKMAWAPDGRHIFFSFLNGSVEGPYLDAQPRVYSVNAFDAPPNAHTRWAAKFAGAVTDFAALPGGGLLAAGRIGTAVQTYTQVDPGAEFRRQVGWPGTYEQLSTASHSGRVAFVYSSLERPSEAYLAEDPEKLEQARPITRFNRLFTERALPQGKPYRWAADDGTTVEGMLIFPPGKFGDRHLRMLTLIHGGPEDADGDHFEADWYQWATLAATKGWLVFQPNYRGSIGYGDTFALGIIPRIVSRPGKDILEGVDALVKDGIADPQHLTIGGYSYGGYMTNWLITQTTRFKAAVSGAGAVEHVANWGNDDTTFDDAYFLGGLPWRAQQNWNDEAAIWQFDKVRTPTHVVGGADDIRVYVGEDYLLERALRAQGVPTSLLIFPGEGHDLDRNPWHGKIKVREELKWLEKYGGK